MMGRSRRLLRGTAQLVTILALITTGPAVAQVPIKVLDVGVGNTARPDIAFDHNDQIVVSYRHEGDHALYIAMSEFGWASTLIEADTVDYNCSASIALDSQGYWAVTYYDEFHDLLKVAGPALTLSGDFEPDGDVDLNDFNTFSTCQAGPDEVTPPPGCDPADFDAADLDCDEDVDLADFSIFQTAFTG
ncbi:MAG: hypothetical protein KAY37_09325 [Phycisphaerae bacterium]|nr:hypothetical protein [Phycisphaerae bacterium]